MRTPETKVKTEGINANCWLCANSRIICKNPHNIIDFLESAYAACKKDLKPDPYCPSFTEKKQGDSPGDSILQSASHRKKEIINEETNRRIKS